MICCLSTAEYAELGNTLNWDASFPYQSHGNFIRALPQTHVDLSLIHI